MSGLALTYRHAVYGQIEEYDLPRFIEVLNELDVPSIKSA